jgi:hypothetical protein
MKKFVLTLSFLAFTVAASAQEKSQNAESKHVCTETCNHGAMAMTEKKSCCSEKAGEAKACSEKKETAVVNKKSCCSEKETAGASCTDKPNQTAAAREKKSCCSKPAGAGTEK